MEQNVLDQIGTVLKNAGYVKCNSATSPQKHHTNQQFQLPTQNSSTQDILIRSKKDDHVFMRPDGVWLVCDKNKQEYGRFMSEEWALKWVDVLIRSTV